MRLTPASASLLVAIVAFLAFTPTMTSYFNAEELGIIQLHRNDTFGHWLTTVFGDYTQGMWGFPSPSIRPVEALDYFIESRLWGGNPTGYHVTSMLLHALTSVLVLMIAYRLTPANLVTSTIAALLFAVHPVHAEAVSWIGGRTDLFPACFMLATVYCFGLYRTGRAARNLIAAFVFAALAFLSKETAVVLPFLLLGYDLFVPPRSAETSIFRRLGVHAGFLALLVAYTAIRWISFGAPLSNWTNPGGNYRSTLLSDFFAGQVRLIGLLVVPVNVFQVRIHEPLVLALSILLLLAVAVLVWRMRGKPEVSEILRPVLYFGAAWYVISVPPLVLAPAYSRYLYLPSAGVCIAFPLLLSRILPKKAAHNATVVGLALMTGLLVSDNLLWGKATNIGRDVKNEVVRLDENLPQQGAILLDVPLVVDGVVIWKYVSPFVFEPPFSRAGLSERVLEKPAMYYHEGLWESDRALLMAAVRRRPEASYVVRVDERGAVFSAPLSSSEVESVLRRFYTSGSWWVPGAPPD